MWLKIKRIFIPCRENNFRPNFLRSRFLFFYLIFLLGIKLAFISFLVYLPKSILFAQLSRDLLIELTNEVRVEEGLNELKENPLLNKAAFMKAQDMLTNDYFAHQSPEGKTPWYWIEKAGYEYQSAGENLAIGFMDSEELIKAWHNSFSHRHNLLDPYYQEIGMAVVRGEFEGKEVNVVVQLFARPAKSKNIQPPKELSYRPQKTTLSPESKKEIKEIEEVKTATATGTATGTGTEELNTKSEELHLFLSESKTVQEPSTKIFRFMIKNFDNFLQNITFYSIILIAFVLSLTISFRVNLRDRNFIYKTIYTVLLLMLLGFLNKQFVLEVVPHVLLIK
ncbi:MAG: hypothetical protein DRH33_02405 [Candidatus Nealsonbacteria bacterium]|nr:MAG: hypothetical protein DRH33_02405 [Candidatus Nealsonbacteria bacterium]